MKSKISRMLLSAVMVACCVCASLAQNAGTIGIQSKLQTAFLTKTATYCSGIFSDIGQGSNILFVVNTAGGGGQSVVDFEWSPTGAAPFYPIVSASYNDLGTSTHVLSTNGYFPNLRTCLTYTSGTWSAWYTSTSGPLSYVTPAVGSNGPVSPPICDKWTTATVPNTTGGFVGPFPLNTSSDTVIVCGIMVSFQGATTAGSLLWEWASSSGCATPTTAFTDYTTASTPQQYAIPVQVRSYVGASVLNYFCVNNTSGTQIGILINWGSIRPQ